jgi:hypothetical protein
MLGAVNGDAANKILNGNFLTETVANKPDNWTIDAAFTSTLAAATAPALGKVWSLAFSALSGYKLCTQPSFSSGIVPGSTWGYTGRLKTVGFEANGNGPSPGQGKVDAQVYVQCAPSNALIQLTGATGVGADIDGVCSNVFTVPAGTTSMQAGILVGPRGGNISGTLQLTQLDLRPL